MPVIEMWFLHTLNYKDSGSGGDSVYKEFDIPMGTTITQTTLTAAFTLLLHGLGVDSGGCLSILVLL